MLLAMPAILIQGCSGSSMKANNGSREQMADCPDRPNCVFSKARNDRHAVAPFRLKDNTPAVWQGVREVVANLPRTTVVKATDRYLHAECKSRVFGFIDDLELQLHPETGDIHIRSASRVGYSDMGVNRRRVETLRQNLKKNALIR